MASSQPRDGRRPKDYIARIRYSNALPPPPNPPKLLDIPGTGLSGGQYTSAGYASRLAREQPLNIEADQELGMPIDLIGVPGVFDGDERAIMARPGHQPLHPADKALLRPLASLGKPNAASGAVSFLRRTEYTASQTTQHFSSSTSKDLLRVRHDKKRKPSLNKEDPINIMRNIVKGFDIAYPHDAYRGEDSSSGNLRGAQVTDAELKAWSNPKHPSKPELKLLDSYPVLPDLDAIPTTGFYAIMQFHGNPATKTGGYDRRLDTAILKPIPDEQAILQFQEKTAAWEESDRMKPAPIQEYDYDYFLPDEESAVPNLKRKFNVNDPDNDDPSLYTDDVADDQRAFKYKRSRRYETFKQNGDPNEFYNDTVALALHDPELDTPGVKQRLQKGAYIYPIVQRTGLRPKRNVGKMAYQVDEGKIDELYVTIADMDEDMRAEQAKKKATLEGAGKAVDEAVG